MSQQRILTLYLGLMMLILTAHGCGDHVSEPQAPVRTPGDSGPGASASEGNDIAPPSYFPLHEGDRWVYVITGPSKDDRGRSSETAEVIVTGSHALGQLRVYQVDDYLFPISDQQTEFYNEPPGRTMELGNLGFGLWYPWWSFAGAEALIAIPVFHQDCVHGSSGVSLGLRTVSVPAGTFPKAVTIRYDSTPCADLGFAREVLAPHVGLIERTVLTIAGEVTWSLVYAEVGDRTWGSLPER